MNGVIKLDNSYRIPLGILGCENAFAHRFVKNGGGVIYNIGDIWKVYHYD